MKPFFSWSLRTHLYVLVLVAIIPALGIILNSGLEMHRHAIADGQAQIMNLVGHIAHRQERLEASTRVLLMVLSREPAIQRCDKAATEALLRPLLANLPEYANFIVATPEGTTYASAKPAPSFDITDRMYYQEVIRSKSFVVGNYAISRTTKIPVIHFAYPVLDAAGRLAGILIAAFNLASYSQVFNQADLPPDSCLVLTDSQGIRLLHYPHFGTDAGTPEPPEILTQMTGPRNTGTFRYHGEDGIERLYGYERLRLEENPNLGLVIRIGIPQQAILAGPRALLRRNLILLGVISAFALGSAGFLGQTLIMRRVNRLVEASHRLGQGDLQARTGLPYREGELGQLAQAMDGMAQALEDHEVRRQHMLAALQDSRWELALRNQVADIFLSTPDAVLYEEILAVVQDTLDSPLGFFGFVDGEGNLVVPSMSREIWQECQVTGKDRVFGHQTWGQSIWGQSLRDKQAYIANQPLSTPPGHLPITRAISVPLIDHGEAIGIFTVANKPTDYLREDQHRLAALAAYVAPILNARLGREREERDRRLAEAALALEKERLQVTLRSIGDGVIATDTDGRVVLMNGVAETLTGWPLTAAQGRPLEEVFVIVNEKTRQRCANPVATVLATGAAVELANHTLLISRDGQERVLVDSGAPIIDASGGVIGVVLVFQDITQKRQVEQELFKMEKLRSLGVLAGGIAHDFNNILTGILGNISLARLDLDGHQEAGQRLLEAEHATLRARNLVKQLLTFAKGGSPITEITKLTRIIPEAAQFACHGSAVQCDFSFPEEIWPVEVDAGQISQVIHNLVLNAIQAMPTGGRIHIRGENLKVEANSGLPLTPGPYVRVEVQDQGSGIPAEHLSKIFDPFFTTKQQGSGLGLTTAYSILQNHRGLLTVESQVGAGSTFSLYLPGAITDRVREAINMDKAVIPGQGRILVMDDEALVREVLGQMLKHLGYEVAMAPEGAAAIDLYLQAQTAGRPFAAVIMDLTVPGGMGGKEAIAKLRQLDPQVVGLVSSGYADDPIMSAYREHGFAGVIAKPYKIGEMSVALHQALKGPEAPLENATG